MSYIKDSQCSVQTPVIWGNHEKPIYGKGVSILPFIPGKRETKYEQSIYLEKLLPLEEYDLIIVLYSGGKDSTVSLLRLLEMGVPKEKIELWHHDIVFLTSCTRYKFTRLKLILLLFWKEGCGEKTFCERSSPHIKDRHTTVIKGNRKTG